MHLRAVGLLWLTCTLVLLLASASANRVYELTDKFLDAYKKDTKSWLVKFYAPWCHHCRQMEPMFMQVAQRLHSEEVGVYVGRIDCTRFTNVASHFSVRGFPTLLFVTRDKVVEYHGDRTKEELIDFAKRLKGPRVRTLDHCNDLVGVLNNHKVFFVYFGDQVPGSTNDAIEEFYSVNWFYHSKSLCPGYDEGLHVIKGNEAHVSAEKFVNETSGELVEWIKLRRFPQFIKVTPGNMNYLLSTKKILIIALVEEYHSVGKLVSGKHEDFKELLEAISHSHKDKDKFIFGWCSNIDMINSIAMGAIEPLPQVIVIDSTTLQYHVMEEDPLPENIVKLIDGVLAGSVPMIGGDSLYHRFRRGLYDMITSLVGMYRGNPVLTILLLGLPMGFLAIIIYTSCCSDILDATEEDEEEEELLAADHQKSE